MKNIFIYIADAVRYDLATVYFDKDVIRTLSPGSWTPPSFSSIISGKEPNNHNVDSFNQSLSKEIETVFDSFENYSFYANPNDALMTRVLKNHVKEPEEFYNLEQPFVYIERANETHMPYNRMNHGNRLEVEDDEPTSGRSYIRKLKTEDKWPELYHKSVKSSIDHFHRHVEELKEEDLYEDTLIIFTSDHGEFIDEKSFGIPRVGHGHPIHSALLDVPTVFYNYDLNVNRMRSIDIIPTALGIIDKAGIGEGIDVRNKQELIGSCQSEGQDKFITKWKMTESGPVCLEPAKLRYYKLIEDYKAFKQRFDNKFDIPELRAKESKDKDLIEEIDI